MFCPGCKDEFRSGFTRCERCGVDLVDELPKDAPRPDEVAPQMPVRMAEYCGFFALDDARRTRERLRTEQIRCDILIREAPDEPSREEYWLRVETDRAREAHAIIGDPADSVAPEDQEGEGDFDCSECGKKVAAEESFCASCGARFEEA